MKTVSKIIGHGFTPGKRGWLLFLMILPSTGFAADAPGFSRDIRPILLQHCFKCHGPDQQKNGLRFDDRSVATRAVKSGKTPIVPRKVGESELIRRVTSTDPDERMPHEGEPLNAQQIAKLRAWIEAGAEYQVHWAYVKPVTPVTPEVQGSKFKAQNPIDNFILARLEKEGLKPSLEAPRATLIRRVSLDLIGLPPTIEEVDAFVNDKSPEAYENVVDRLLASERYGEKWARMWLDLARYGDSAGYQHDMEMPLWLYRDWVIRAFNADMPFDQFTIHQMAGDLLPETQNSKLKTSIH